MADSSYRSDNPISKRQHYELTRSALWTERASHDSHWRELAEFVKPRRLRAYISDRNRGDRRNQKIIDSTACFALRTLQSGMHAGMTSPARPWFRLSTHDPELAAFGPVKRWLHLVTERMFGVFVKSNVYTALPTLYGDMGLFATAAMAVVDDDKDLFRCHPFPIGSYALGLSERGIVDTFIREYQMIVHQVVMKFVYDPETKKYDWTRVSKTVKTLWDKGEFQSNVDICWIIAPNIDRDDDKVEAKYLPWASCHFERGQNEEKFLKESGFNEFPIIAPRWDAVAEDTYGTESPGMVALGDIKGLQMMTKRKAQAVELQINPAMQAPSNMKSHGVSMLPGEVNYVDLREQQQGIRPVREVNTRIEDIRVDIADTRYLIRRAFYEDLFLMLAQSESPQKTAREIQERHEEKLLALGPVLERSNDELHEPLIDRTFPMMERAGFFPPAPKELDGVTLRVEYTSIMSEAQKLAGLSALDGYTRTVMALGQVVQSTLHKTNWPELINEYGARWGINPEIIVSDDEAAASVQAEQQAQARAQQAAMAAQGAKAARDLSGASMEGDTALSRMAERSVQ